MTTDSDPEISALKGQLFAQLIALLIISGTLTAFLFRQATVAGKDLDAVKPQAVQFINTFKQNQPAIENFVNEVVAYGQKHPDFLPVLKKYGIASVAAAPAAPSAAPAK